MELKGRRILLISPEPWAGLHMSKHHLAEALAARGNTVVFLDPPVRGTTGIAVHREGGVLVARYHHWLRGANRLPKAVHMAYYRALLRRVAAATGGPFDILWCFDTSRMQWFPEGMGLKLLHLADYDILHQGMGLVRTATLVLTTGQVVKDHVEHLARAPVVNVGHALDERWTLGADTLHTRAPRAPKQVVFMGQLATHYNDWEGFEAVVSAHPELAFTFIGPFDPYFPEPAFHALRALPNATFTGLMAKDELIPRVREADILLFGFRTATHARERANPHKVLEYLSTGNVIVGSWTMEYAGRPGLLNMADAGAPLMPVFERVLAHFAELNSSTARRERIAFALERTMGGLIARIENLLPA